MCCIRNPFLTQTYEAGINLLQAPVGCAAPYWLCFGNIFWLWKCVSGLIKIVWFTHLYLSIHKLFTLIHLPQYQRVLIPHIISQQNRCWFFAFFRGAKEAQSKWGAQDMCDRIRRRMVGHLVVCLEAESDKQWCVDNHYFFAPSLLYTRFMFCSPRKCERKAPVLQATYNEHFLECFVRHLTTATSLESLVNSLTPS